LAAQAATTGATTPKIVQDHPPFTGELGAEPSSTENSAKPSRTLHAPLKLPSFLLEHSIHQHWFGRVALEGSAPLATAMHASSAAWRPHQGSTARQQTRLPRHALLTMPSFLLEPSYPSAPGGFCPDGFGRARLFGGAAATSRTHRSTAGASIAAIGKKVKRPARGGPPDEEVEGEAAIAPVPPQPPVDWEHGDHTAGAQTQLLNKFGAPSGPHCGSARA